MSKPKTDKPNTSSLGRPLTKIEIKQRATDFAQRWEGTEGLRPSSEKGEKQTWWNELFKVYGTDRAAVAIFEDAVSNLKGNASWMDVFFKGKMVGEHKSRGQDLGAALKQAQDYVQFLVGEGRGHDVPRYLVVSDFERIRVYDLLKESGASEPLADFATIELPKNIDALMFLAGGIASEPKEEQAIDIRAVELLGDLHDALEDGGYEGHKLEQFLVRCLFCLFADDTDIFESDNFHEIVKTSKSDGSDLGGYLAQAFTVLNTPTVRDGEDDPLRRRKPQPPTLFSNLPYVNGDLFAEELGFATFDEKMRGALLRCCEFDWSKISPAVFGSLFQCVMEPRARRQVGAHYTSEADIMKVIRSLFLDDLERELEDCGESVVLLNRFHDKIASLKFLDPACGCGNFLICAYKQLRRLEHLCLERLAKKRSAKEREKHGMQIDPQLLRVSPSQFFGIEIGEWAARIAEVALILTERQEDVSLIHAITFSRLPLKKGATIHVGNALRTDWHSVLPASECSYVMGNPPFVGAMLMSPEQRQDLVSVSKLIGAEGTGVLDYVAGWYYKAADYIKGSSIHCAFVSTNSISQGEQVGLLWDPLISMGVGIHFGYRTFAWESEARGKAHVHVVIVGFGCSAPRVRIIHELDPVSGNWGSTRATNISPYLFEGASVTLRNRSKPLCSVQPMAWGSQPRDGGHLLLDRVERIELIAAEPETEKWIRPFTGAEEFINGGERYCLWLVGMEPSELRSMPKVLARVEAVRLMRQSSKAEATRKLAAKASLFAQIAQPSSAYLIVPSVSSERRRYIPMGFLPATVVASNLTQVVPNADLLLFGNLTSSMHMAWVRQFCGRLKSDYRYSKDIVYNNYPFPQGVTDEQRRLVEDAAQGILDCRERFLSKGSTLADLYDPLTMPPDLVKAHETLDRAVDRCYRKEPFKTDRERVEFLFALYQKLADPLTGAASVAAAGKSKPPRKRSN